MSNRNGNVRVPTPTSPSPSPEPSSATGMHPSADSMGGIGVGGGLDSTDAELSAAKGEVPFHEALKLGENDPSDIYRQEAEEQTRKVIDSLYDLAVCAADVQVGEERLLSVKVNETIANLSTLFNTSQQHSETNLLPFIPEEILEAVDEGRNPDTWSKNRMARLVSDNQQLAGQRWAMERYRSTLSDKVKDMFPELQGVVDDLDQQHGALRTRPEGQQSSSDVKMEQ